MEKIVDASNCDICKNNISLININESSITSNRSVWNYTHRAYRSKKFEI